FTNSVIHVGPSSSITAVTSFSVMDLESSTSTSTCLDKCAKLVDAILLRASAFLFLLRGTWFIEKVLNPLTKPLAISRYLIMLSSLASYVPNTWLATSLESTFACMFFTPIYVAIRKPAISASYSASLLEAAN
nr:hypothetical protein [Tanacetum cinerariifolium]